MREAKDNLLNSYSQRITENLSFLIAKVYLRNGFVGASTLVTPEKAFEEFSQFVLSVPIYDYRQDDNMTTIIANCTYGNFVSQ